MKYSVLSIKYKFLFGVILYSVYSILYTRVANAGPTSSNYELKQYTFGTSGSDNLASPNYKALGTAGETEIASASSANYSIGQGLIFTLQSNTPPAPTFTNPSSYYNKLKLVVNVGGNPTDTLFAITISSDNFATDRQYVQNDNTIASTLGTEDWQTYSAWGGASGFNIVGLTPGTTYTVKVAARHGTYTQSPWSPTAQAATINATLSFDIDVSSSDTDTEPPFNLDVGELAAATVTTSNQKVWVDIDTNGTGGTAIYVYGTNNGLQSAATAYTINAVSSNLTSISEGYGARGVSAAQSAGGPMEIVSPYNGSGNTVGILDTSKRTIFDSSGQPVTSGRVSFEIQAKASAITKAATDYSDVITIIAAGTF